MDEKTVVRNGPVNKPLHRAKDICFRWQTLRVLLVVCEDYHVLAPIPVPLRQECRDVRHVVDTSLQLVRLAKVVYPN